MHIDLMHIDTDTYTHIYTHIHTYTYTLHAHTCMHMLYTLKYMWM